MRRAQAGWFGVLGSVFFVVLSFSICTANIVAQENPPRPESNQAAPVTPQAETAKPTSDLPEKAENSEPRSVRLGAGDLLEVNVYGVPELTTKARVSNSGDIYLPLIDYVHVGDLELEEAQSLIEKRLGDGGFVRNPHVTIFINEYASQGVNVLGEVVKPGIYSLLGERRLYDLMTSAGGLTEKAGRTVVITHRDNPDQHVIVKLPRDLTQDRASNVVIKPGDTLLFKRGDIVYVVGDVGRPSGLMTDSGTTLTVLRALALAGGTNRTAKLSGARIIRQTPDGAKITRIPLNKLLEAKAPDIPMMADDILFVPISRGRVAAGMVASTAVQAATTVSITRVP
jgi:polysaccharide export outer membrane protein